MSGQYCEHGMFNGIHCQECEELEQLIKNAGGDNALIRELSAKTQEQESALVSKNAALVLAMKALEKAVEDAGERRDYAGAWEWKYGSRWDKEDAARAAALAACREALEGDA